jgi:hypothetical protein
MNEMIQQTMNSFEIVGDDLKTLRVVDHDKDIVMKIVRLYGAMSICIDVLRGLDGEDYTSKECNMSIQEMIKKIKEYTNEQNYDDSDEMQHVRYLSLYDHLYSKIYNLVSILKKQS